MEIGWFSGNLCDSGGPSTVKTKEPIGLETENKRNRSKLNYKEIGFNNLPDRNL